MLQKLVFCLLLFTSWIVHAGSAAIEPKLTIVFICDALSKEALDRADPFLVDGLKFLKNNSVNFTNAFQPHANCSTTVGHASFMTGSFPIQHGMVSNLWVDADNNLVESWQDPDTTTAGVFNPSQPGGGMIYGPVSSDPVVKDSYGYSTTDTIYGASPRNYRTDTVSDQLILSSNPTQSTKVFSITLDSMTAIMMSGRMGKAFWMDGPSGLFTTSKYYFDTIPDWVQEFNQAHPVPASFVWQPVYPLGSAAYNFPNAQNYQYRYPIPGVPAGSTIFNQTLPSIFTEPPFTVGALTYIAGPPGIQTIFEFVKEAIHQELDLNGNNRLVLFINIDSLDYLGGAVGPQTQEALDIIYRIDRGIGDLLRYVSGKLPRSQFLFAFLADEGLPGNIPELQQAQGFDLARRTLAQPFIFNSNILDTLNSTINTKFGISSCCQYVIPPFV